MDVIYTELRLYPRLQGFKLFLRLGIRTAIWYSVRDKKALSHADDF